MMMHKIADFITTKAKIIFIVLILITIFLGIQAKNIKIEDDITKYISKDDPDIRFYSEVFEKFGGSQVNLSMISLEYEDLFTVKNLENIKNIVAALEKAPFIKTTNSFFNLPKIITTEVGIEVKDLIEVFPQNDQEAKELKDSLLKDNLVIGKFLSEDGNVALIMIESVPEMEGGELKTELGKIVEPLKGEATEVHYFGMPLITAEISESSWKTMRLALMAALTVFLVLYFCFRTLRGVFLPLLIASLSSFWVLGVVASTSQNVTMMISVIPVLMIALATAYGIHFISRYYEERSNSSPLKAVNTTIQDIFIPILMSALTTIAGFLSLTTTTIKPMTEFGIFSTMGIFFAFILATFFLGSLFTLFPAVKVQKNFSYEAKDLITKILRSVSHLILKDPKLVLIPVLVIIMLSLAFATRVTMESTMESRLGEESNIAKIMHYFNEKFGGTDFLYIYTKSNDIKNPYVLRQLKKIGDYSQRFSSFGESSSIADFLTQLNEAMEKKKIIPASTEKIDNLWFFAGNNEYITGMIGENGEDTLMQIRTREMVYSTLNEAIEEMNSFMGSIPKKVKKVNLSEIDEESKPKYYGYLAEEIIHSLKTKGVEIKNEEVLKERLIELSMVSTPILEICSKECINEILAVSALEIEDLGLESSSLAPLLSTYIKNNQSPDTFIKELREKLELSEDDAIYLQGVLEDSTEIVQERERIRLVQAEVEKLIGKELKEEEKDLLWYLTDQEVYLPDDKGDIEVSFQLTGIPVISDRINESLYRGQIRSLIVAFFAVCLMLILQFNSLTLGLIAMLPILLTVATSFGLMGLFHIDLNVGTIMVASIAIGAGIDYTIHFISRYSNELKRRTKVEAIKTALTGTGRAIVFNSLAVAAGVFVLFFSDIAMLSNFGILIGSIMILSVIYTLTILPILLNKIKIKEEVKQ